MVENAREFTFYIPYYRTFKDIVEETDNEEMSVYKPTGGGNQTDAHR
jgi:hypothetical protein